MNINVILKHTTSKRIIINTRSKGLLLSSLFLFEPQTEEYYEVAVDEATRNLSSTKLTFIPKGYREYVLLKDFVTKTFIKLYIDGDTELLASESFDRQNNEEYYDYIQLKANKKRDNYRLYFENSNLVLEKK